MFLIIDYWKKAETCFAQVSSLVFASIAPNSIKNHQWYAVLIFVGQIQTIELTTMPLTITSVVNQIGKWTQKKRNPII